MKFRIFLNNFHSPQVSENNKLITLIKCQKAYALCLEIHQILHNMSHPSWRRNRLPMYDSRIDFNFFLTTLTDLAYTEQNTQCEIKYNAIFYYYLLFLYETFLQLVSTTLRIPIPRGSLPLGFFLTNAKNKQSLQTVFVLVQILQLFKLYNECILQHE